MGRRVHLAAAVAALAATAGCSEPAAPAPATLALHFPEVLIVNDHSRYLVHGDQTEVVTGDLMNAVAVYYLQSSALVANGISPLLVKQITISSPTGNGVPAFLGGVDALDYGTALTDFAAYQAALQDLHPHDLAILLTHRPAQVDGKVEPAILEAANRGSACSRETGAAIAYTGHSLAFDASVVAHALGHVLGMCHDPPDRDATCPGLPGIDNPGTDCARRIMAATPVPSAPYTEFSTCSASDLGSFLEGVMSDPGCLAPPVIRTR